MVEKIFNFFDKEIDGLHSAAYLLAIFSIASQVLALVRDKLLAHFFGAGQMLDLYYASFRIPDFLFITIGSLVSLSVLVPILAKKRNSDINETQVFLNGVFTCFVGLMIAVSLIVLIFTPEILKLIYRGFDQVALNQTATLTRILLLSPLILGISNILGTIVQSKNKFLVYALSPVLYNLGIIMGIIFLYPIFGLRGVVYGVIIGALLHLLVQIPSVKRLSLLPKFTLKLNWSEIKEVAALSIPRTITLSMNHIVIFFLLSLASGMAVGSISVFSLAFNLQSVPLSIIGVSYSLAAFPTLSRMFSLGEKDQFITELVNSMRHVIFWSLPITVTFIVLRAQIVRVIYGSGLFSWTDTRLTAAVLSLLVLSIVAQSLSLLLIRSMYARGSTGKPFYISIVSGLFTIFSSVFFINLFNEAPTIKYFFESMLKITDLTGTSIIALALGFSLGSILDFVLILVVTLKDLKGFSSRLYRTTFEAFSSSVILGFVAYIGLQVFSRIFSLDTFSGVLLQGLLSGLIGIVTWATTLKLLKNREINEIWTSLRSRLGKSKVIGPDPEVA